MGHAHTSGKSTALVKRNRALSAQVGGGSEGTSRRSAVVHEHVVAFRKRRSGSTKSHSDASRSAFDWTKSRAYFDEPGAERGNCGSSKRERRVVFQERRIANDEPFVVFDE